LLVGQFKCVVHVNSPHRSFELGMIEFQLRMVETRNVGPGVVCPAAAALGILGSTVVSIADATILVDVAHECGTVAGSSADADALREGVASISASASNHIQLLVRQFGKIHVFL